MARQSQAADELSPAAHAALTRLGQAFAKRVGVSRTTLRKLINGDPGVSIGTLISVLDTLGLLNHLDDVAAPEKDALGQSLRLQRGKQDVGLNMNTDF